MEPYQIENGAGDVREENWGGLTVKYRNSCREVGRTRKTAWARTKSGTET